MGRVGESGGEVGRGRGRGGEERGRGRRDDRKVSGLVRTYTCRHIKPHPHLHKHAYVYTPLCRCNLTNNSCLCNMTV